MRATEDGIIINRAEISALLAFTGDTERFSSVQFRVTGSAKLIASASDGNRAVEVTAEADNAETGDWGVDRTFLEHMRRGCDEGETVALLKVSRGGLKIGVVQAIEGGDERARVTWPREAATTQTSMDQVRGAIGNDVALEGLSWFAFDPSEAKLLGVVATACEKCPMSIFPGKDPGAAVHFEASSIGGRWRGVIMPTRVSAPGEAADDDDDTGGASAPGTETTTGVGDPARTKPLKLEPSLATAKKRRPKASKAPKRKGSKKRK